MNDETAGHISLIGAYNAAKKMVLILDVDREWVEPYWVQDEKLFKSMNTPDSETGKSRGYVILTI